VATFSQTVHDKSVASSAARIVAPAKTIASRRRVRFAARIAQRAVDAQDKTQRRGEALFVLPPRNVRGVRFAVDNEAQDPVLATETLERQDLLIHPFRLRRPRRAQHDLAGGALERRIDQRPEIGGARELVAIPEDRREASRDLAARRHRADQCLRRSIPLQRAVQPRRPARVAMAVADEGAVFGRVHCFMLPP